MAYDQAKLVEKLRGINASQQSIETVSMYCQVLKRHAPNVVTDWAAEYHKQPTPRKVALLYLANDVLQNSRKKGAEYVAAFHKVLPHALHAAATSGDAKLAKSATRLVEIWNERRVFSAHAITALKEAVGDAATPSKDHGLASALEQTQRAHESRVTAAAACANIAEGAMDPQARTHAVNALTTALAAADAERLTRQRAVQALTAALQQQQAALAELSALSSGWQVHMARLQPGADDATCLVFSH